jgi:peroxiredoxin
MKRRTSLTVFVILLATFLVACTPVEKTMGAEMPIKQSDTIMEEKTLDPIMEKTAVIVEMDEQPIDAVMDKTPEPIITTMTPEPAMMAPDWFTAEFTHPVSGESFKIDDFEGKVVLVETFAQWCSTCLSQQREVRKLHEMLGMPDDLVTVGLDIDPNEDANSLKMYLEKHGFNWYYAVASAETAREISNLYGTQFLNPPSAPMLIIDRRGEVHPLPFGIKSAEDLQKAVEPFLSGDM